MSIQNVCVLWPVLNPPGSDIHWIEGLYEYLRGNSKVNLIEISRESSYVEVTAAVTRSDFVIANITNCSTGLGLQIATALHACNPVYCIHEEEFEIELLLEGFIERYDLIHLIASYRNKDDFLRLIDEILKREIQD